MSNIQAPVHTITVFGASGKVGSLVVVEALKRGYAVIAFTHSQPLPLQHNHLSSVQGDIHEPEQVRRAIEKSDAVICCLGSWGTPTKDIVSSGMRSIIPAMEKIGLHRIVSLTGADARAPGDALGFIHHLSHWAISLIGGKVLRDGEGHIRLLANSNLDWTVIRSPFMLPFGKTLRWHLSTKRPLPTATIPRVAVAHSLLDQIEDKQFIKVAPYLSRQ